MFIVKLREREEHRVDSESHSKVIYRWWMVDILSLMLYTKFGCHHHHHRHWKSLNLQN